MKGLLHIYCGDGKGKTTAAIGLAVRAAGAGKQVVFAQFLKNRISSEIISLQNLGTVRTLLCQTIPLRFKHMNEEQRKQASIAYSELLDEALLLAQDIDLLIMDEAIAACNYGVIDEDSVIRFLRTRQEKLEVVLTGRYPSAALLAQADYVTEMRKIKHPYDHGVHARRGIEF